MPYHCNVCNKEHATEEVCPMRVDIQDAYPIKSTGVIEKIATEVFSGPEVKQQPHYNQFKIQPITFIVANKLDYNQGNVVKFRS